jgi:hypothetical protein
MAFSKPGKTYQKPIAPKIAMHKRAGINIPIW